jgi:hypothetical protein
VSGLADPPFTFPAGIQWSDLGYITVRVLVIALVVSVLGMLLARRIGVAYQGFPFLVIKAVITPPR